MPEDTTFEIRRATRADHDALKRVCLMTGDAGQDASDTEDDPDLLGLVFAVPYQIYEPEFAFVIENRDGVCGYVLGAPDTRRFMAQMTHDWFAALQPRYADPGTDRSRWKGSDWARHAIHYPDREPIPELAPYPAHGHIDLLPVAQGKDMGRRAMEHLMDRMRAAGVTGLHMGVNARNARALRFYERLGFTTLEPPGIVGDAVYVVRTL